MKPRIFTTTFPKVYPLIVQKAERKGHANGEDFEKLNFWYTHNNNQLIWRWLDEYKI
ncbi:DUF2200 family protein [Desulfosporosinus shakirovi]|uniref:DUF2200 family protein n=1 Tax=Desulfosporosinus shakirovi TaxID=2885154 RepID=UPI001E41872C|nr:DUF2200 family protein [Desulfosporosinus sp. SRJS8]MCB8814744.1 DUF2200 family protein [Desulfosporosinus sp. SRJS8]